MEEPNNNNMMMEKEVIDFFKRVINNKIDKDSYITDYCKNEDNAYYIFLEFFSKFNIEEGNMNLDMYFYKSVPILSKLFKRKNEELNSHKKRISINHLIDVAVNKKWFDPN